MSKVADTVWALAKPVVEKRGLSLWDVEYAKEGGRWILRIYIDKDEGVSIDDCEEVSREVEALLDRDDPVPGSYVLEVASAGLERPLKRPADFAQFMGHLVEVSLFKAREGAKTFGGHLAFYDGQTVGLDTGITFDMKDVAQVCLRLE